ncbi:MAG: RHS repeat domain-containing protein [Flavobacteriales bacterium]
MKYTTQQEIRKRFDSLQLPYYGKNNDDYAGGTGFCCSQGESRLGDGVQSGSVNNRIPTENENAELYQYYYHPDHLGSSSYITNLDGEVVQHVEYVPFGEVFLEERNNTWNTPYLFNAKELDEETGLYYYGARYYNPRISLWLSVDPLAEKYPNISPYAYVANNPINYIDPDGREPIKPLVGTINQALDLFRSRGLTTIKQINDFYENPMDAKGNRLTNYTRYVYTEGNGWIDLKHYFGTIVNTETAMDLLENVQCAAGQGSCYSYEGLPSNHMGGSAPVWKEVTDPNKRFSGSAQVEKTGEELLSAVKYDFLFAGAKAPSEAPNYDKLPQKERPKVPSVKRIIRFGHINIPVFYSSEEKGAMIKTGKYVPQNFSEKPYDLNKFPTPSKEYQ